MEDIDGGLHPAVDGQSLDEDEDDEMMQCSPGKWGNTLQVTDAVQSGKWGNTLQVNDAV